MIAIPSDLITILKSATHVTVLTGAGVSQESGLRTFRDAQTGFWAQYRPEDLATPEAFERDPKLVWDWYAMRREIIKEVKPNPGHYALVQMARLFPNFTLITQNVDGLHQQAGSKAVIELHGNIQEIKCSRCTEIARQWDDNTENVPICTKCGGLLRPNVIWFGESLPGQALVNAAEASSKCDVFFTIGTSGLVQPAASLAIAAKNSNAIVVQINLDATPVNPKVDYILVGKSGEILPEIIRAGWDAAVEV
ncbi:MAG: NAD-dependent deacylase [Chloroflexota bacterium]